MNTLGNKIGKIIDALENARDKEEKYRRELNELKAHVDEWRERVLYWEEQLSNTERKRCV